MRANRLISSAFYGGFVKLVRLNEIHRQRKLLALSHAQARALIKGIQALKANAVRGRHAKMIRQQSAFHAGAKMFSEWQVLTKNMIKAKRLRTKVLVERQF